MSRRVAAFTLIELLVAVAGTVVLAGILIVVTRGALDAWRRTQSGLLDNAQVKLVFDLIERDLRAAIHSSAGEVRLVASIDNAVGNLVNQGWTQTASLKPSGAVSQVYLSDSLIDVDRRIARARFGLSGVWLRFLTTNVESAGSMPTVVSYQLVRRPITGDVSNPDNLPLRYTLFRSVVSIGNTFDEGYDVRAAAYGSTSPQPQGSRSPSTVMNPNNSDALCANVVDFGVWLYRLQAGGSLVRVFPTVTAGGVEFAAIGPGTSGQTVDYPDYADVMVRILSEEGAIQLERLERGEVAPPTSSTYDDWWWSIVETHSVVHIHRVKIGEASP